MLKIVIVDDEKDALEALEWKINKCITDEVSITKCSSPVIAVDLVKELKPHLVFLDIQMPEMDGFSFIEKFNERSFEVIFTTAYDEYGIKAVKAKALDYLLKPIDIDELTLAMIKLKKVLKNKAYDEVPAKINIQADGKVYLIPKEDVLYLKSDKSYTTINLTSGKNIIATKTLKEIQKKFTCPEFVRVHNSYVVNLNYVIEYNKGANELTLNDGTIVAVSRSKKNEVINALNIDK
ncbi:LytTR family DNA-binding domain-containing protein [uncultured Tenacibaculum sp.]|uniref:LytR/AlgR family response regulator transcription factor n=1 Tax=uncultured Tenacibaculum sp. TaxID=174713 RepID=UPI00260FDF3D|nr:LytTR family DNA-binding domain-containing protein [uncultured Tenacibaculum sp.]